MKKFLIFFLILCICNQAFAAGGYINLPASGVVANSCSAGKFADAIAADGTLTCATPSGSPTGTAGGDLSGTYPNPTVSKVLGQTPTSSNVANTVVLRDGSGIFSTSNITGSNSGFNFDSGTLSNTAGTFLNLGTGQFFSPTNALLLDLFNQQAYLSDGVTPAFNWSNSSGQIFKTFGQTEIQLNGGAPTDVSDSNAALIMNSGGNATNFWFNLKNAVDGGTGGSFGFVEEGVFKSGFIYQTSNTSLYITNDIGNPFPAATSGFGLSAGGKLLVNIMTDDGVNALQAAGSSSLDSGKILTNASGVLSKYNNVSTVTGGVPALYGQVNLTAQGAAISATTIITPAAAAMYRVCWVATVTRAASTSSILGGTAGFQIKYTDADDSVVKTTATGVSPTSAGNTTATAISGCENANVKASTALQYLFDYSSTGVTSMQYNLHVRAEAL